MSGRPAPLTIAPEPLASSDARALIARLDAELTARYPDPEDNHFELTEDQVADGRGVFVIARLATGPVTGPVGCGALREIEPGTGEIKRMYVAPSARGLGIGRHVLGELERHARRLGIQIGRAHV